MARHVARETEEEALCLAGGVALNCVANGKILAERIFDRIWIQPAAGDAGGALGAALFAWHAHAGEPRQVDGNGRDRQRGSYLGPSWSTDEIESWLTSRGYPYERFSESEAIERTADALAEEKVVGWFTGRMEFGPRALGGRSILGDARSPAMQSTMNLKIKFRESFRPFAPSVLVEDVSEYFELEEASPYMLIVAPVREQRRLTMSDEQQRLFGIEKLKIPRSDIPAVTHVDYSARVQTVDRADSPRYHDLIRRFKEKTGYGVIVNTSFNVRGEPIVCSPEDAYLCFMRTEMDVLVLENIMLVKSDQPEFKEHIDWRTEFELD
jgi:carbamoyltransferase